MSKSTTSTEDQTKSQLVGAIQATAAIAETIRELGSIPNGHLYAQCLGRMTFETYSAIIALLKRAELVAENNSVLRWVGPAFQNDQGGA
jgi:hypothetical protein